MRLCLCALLAWYFLLPVEKPGTIFSGNATDYKEIGPFESAELCEKGRKANTRFKGSVWEPLGCFEKK